MVVENLPDTGQRLRVELAGRGAFLEDPPRVLDVPVILVQQASHQLPIAQCSKIALPGFGLAVGDLVDPAITAVDFLEIVAFTGVGPVDDEDAAVGSVVQADTAEPGVVSEQKIAAVMS